MLPLIQKTSLHMTACKQHSTKVSIMRIYSPFDIFPSKTLQLGWGSCRAFPMPKLLLHHAGWLSFKENTALAPLPLLLPPSHLKPCSRAGAVVINVVACQWLAPSPLALDQGGPEGGRIRRNPHQQGPHPCHPTSILLGGGGVARSGE